MVYRIVQNDVGLVVVKGDKVMRTSVKYYKGRFENFRDVRRFFEDNYRGTCVGLKTNFNSGERIALLKILWEGLDPHAQYERKLELVW